MCGFDGAGGAPRGNRGHGEDLGGARGLGRVGWPPDASGSRNSPRRCARARRERRARMGHGSRFRVLSSSPDGPLARDDGGVMTNDPRGCDGSKPSRKGSRGAVASHLIHSTSPFESPRNRPEVGPSHVPHPCTCGPQSRWDRCTSLHIRGARGAGRWSSHRSSPGRHQFIL